LVVQAAQAVKVVVRKVLHHLAVVATKEAANVVVSAEAMTEEVVTKVVPAVVKIAVVVKIVLVAVLVKIVVAAAVIVPVDQAEDNNNKSSRDRHRLDIKA
jgi:uncharacterized membrane protein YadS